MATLFKNLRRVLLHRDRVHLVYDKEGTLLKPRPPTFRYTHIERLLAGRRASYEALIAELAPYLEGSGLAAVSDEPADARAPHWNNGYFSHVDARAAYALAAARKPARIVEVGSGNSTKFFRKAIEDHGLATSITSIDPKPRAEIEGVADRVIKANVLDVDDAVFAALDAGDVLFIDGSHMTFNGTDTTRIFLEILPGLESGVLVHVHDICLPYEYSPLFSERLYSEQYLLACLLLDSERWRPLLPIYYLEREGRFADLAVAGADDTSFWMERL